MLNVVFMIFQILPPTSDLQAFDTPKPPFNFLVVLDFEWTCDNRRGAPPLEIIEFPSVLVRCGTAKHPPRVVDQFQAYVRPTENPTLSTFCTELTAITQDMVDAGVELSQALEQYTAWLSSHGLCEKNGSLCTADGHCSWALVTWSDADIGGALHSQLSRMKLDRPQYFDRWINLKVLFKSHYKREPHGGLQACVESCGLSFNGRAHSGLVDSYNTAKIVMQMMLQGFSFVRTTRGFGTDGEPLGMKKTKSV